MSAVYGMAGEVKKTGRGAGGLGPKVWQALAWL